MARREEPSNPFKKTSRAPASPPKPRRQGGRAPSAPKAPGGPPAPPGGKASKPPAPPGGSQKKVPAPAPKPKPATRTPARAGKSVGLRKQVNRTTAEATKRTDERAKALIEATRSKVTREVAAKNAEMAKAKGKEPSNPFAKKQGGRPAPQRRGGRFNKRNKPQGPAKRVLKLHRGKYMEFKYDVRKILDEEDVADEHRSNVLGQTWAKGERQGIPEAKQFLAEKVEEGIINEACANRILKLIDSLTTRR